MINIKLCMYIAGQRGNVMRPAQSGWFIFFGNTNASTKCHGNPSHDHPSILAKATNVRLLMSLEEKSVAISQLCCNILFIYRREHNPGTLAIWSKYVLAVCVHVCLCMCERECLVTDWGCWDTLGTDEPSLLLLLLNVSSKLRYNSWTLSSRMEEKTELATRLSLSPCFCPIFPSLRHLWCTFVSQLASSSPRMITAGCTEHSL